MKLLVVEDDIRLLAATVRSLEDHGMGVDQATTIDRAEEVVSVNQYDCILLDLNLPDGSGFTFCQNVRSSGDTTPILMLTARDAVEDRIRGLELGADEYVMKPVDSRELVARVKALIRRNSKEPLPILIVGDLRIDTQAQLAERAGVPIVLPSKEFAVLEYLARHSHQLVTRAMLMEHVWGSEFETFSNVVDVYIRNLRRKIDRPDQPRLIHTVRGSGYVLSDQRPETGRQASNQKKPNKT